MAEITQKDKLILAPNTPAQPGSRGGSQKAGFLVSASSNSACKSQLDSSNVNLLYAGDFLTGLGTKIGFAHQDSEKNSRINDSSIDRAATAELGKISNMQLLLSQIGAGNHEFVTPTAPETPANRYAEEALCPSSQEFFPSSQESTVTVEENSVSGPNIEKQRSRKRKKLGVDLNEQPKKRMKMKKHRPKIFDASKPKKPPTPQKIPKAKKIPKEKKERKSAGKSRKIPRTPDSGSQVPKPDTPELLPPQLVMSEKVNEKVNSGGEIKFDNHHQNSAQAPPSCRRMLDFDVKSQVEEEWNEQPSQVEEEWNEQPSQVEEEWNEQLSQVEEEGNEPPSHVEVEGNEQPKNAAHVNDFSLDNLRRVSKIVHTYQRRRCRKNDENIFNLLLVPAEVQEFDTSKGMREIIKKYKRKGLTNLTMHPSDVKHLQLLQFPEELKERRTRRQRRTVYSTFWKAVKWHNVSEVTDKTSSGLGYLSFTLPPMHKRKRRKRLRRSYMLLAPSSKIESCSTGNDNPPIAKSSASSVYNLPIAISSASSLDTFLGINQSFLGVETCPAMDLSSKDSMNDILIGKTNAAELFTLEKEVICGIQEKNLQYDNALLQLENQNLGTKEVELFPLAAEVPNCIQIQENKLEFNDELLELGLSLPQHENKLERDNDLLELGLGLPQCADVKDNMMEESSRSKYFTEEMIPDIEDMGGSNVPIVEDYLKLMQMFERLHMRHENEHLVPRDRSANTALVTQKNENWQLVVRDQNISGALVPHKGRKGKKLKKPPPPKINLDQETVRVWNLLMENAHEDSAQTDDVKKQYWETERELFSARVNSFISYMREIQGNRSFSRWKGSVVDSCVGVFLTQNVSDKLSSWAYLSLASRFPLDKDKGVSSSQELANDIHSREAFSTQSEFQSDQVVGKGEENMVSVIDNQALHSAELDKTINLSGVQEILSHQIDSTKSTISSPRTGEGDDALKVTKDITCEGCTQPLSKCQEFQKKNEIQDDVASSDKHQSSSRKGNKAKTNGKTSARKGKVDKKIETPIDWDELRKMYDGNNDNTFLSSVDPEFFANSVDWDKVRRAETKEIAAAISKRGQHNVLAEKIRAFLNRIFKDHKCIDLEWLRKVPPEKAKEYLLSFNGLGLKSVECVRLLTLRHSAFPVDTNVGRIAVRLGWVPLQPLPGDLEIDLLNNYPLVDSIQKYLWPRLCKLSPDTLYELHYQMITFGKVFCTKGKPKCNACPLKGDCRHYSSAAARSQLRLPGVPQKQKSTVERNGHGLEVIGDEASMQLTMSSTEHFLKDSYPKLISGTQKSCEPIIEMPASPEPEFSRIESEIEGQYDDFENSDDGSDDEMLEVKLNSTNEFRESLWNSVQGTNSPPQSKELVVMSAEAASAPARKLRSMSKLMTKHSVYVIPGEHEILKQFESLEPGDPCEYLFAIWHSDDSKLLQDDEQISGTILIPCRTANRGRFPLNGTYYQVNEVFADDESSHNPISVSKASLTYKHDLYVYCGFSTTSICKEMQCQDIQYCFKKGYVCVRGFDRKTREPKELATWLHPHREEKKQS